MLDHSLRPTRDQHNDLLRLQIDSWKGEVYPAGVKNGVNHGRASIMPQYALMNSPLVVALFELHFTEVPESLLINGLDSFRIKAFELGYPDGVDATHENVDVIISNKKEISHKETRITHRYFFNIGRTRAIVISPSSISFRDSAYTGFNDFYSMWQRILDSAIESFEPLSHVGVQRINLRYVDAFVPNENDQLENYISPKFRLAAQDDEDEKHFSVSDCIWLRKTSDNSGIRVEIKEYLPLTDGLQDYLPAEMLEPEGCRLAVPQKAHWNNLKKHQKYALVDIHHFKNFDFGVPMSTQSINRDLNSLYAEASRVFWKTLTPHAEFVWQKYERS